MVDLYFVSFSIVWYYRIEQDLCDEIYEWTEKTNFVRSEGRLIKILEGRTGHWPVDRRASTPLGLNDDWDQFYSTAML